MFLIDISENAVLKTLKLMMFVFVNIVRTEIAFHTYLYNCASLVLFIHYFINHTSILSKLYKHVKCIYIMIF